MTSTRRRILTIAAATLVALSVSALGGIGLYMLETPLRGLLYAEGHSHDTRIDFYGMVIDAAHKPVDDAKVKLVIEGESLAYRFGAPVWLKETPITVSTNAEGRFSITGAFGRSLRIAGIEKPGYEWILEAQQPHNTGNYDYDGAPGAWGWYVPDKARPAILPLRRVGSHATLISSRGGVDRERGGPDHVNQERPIAEPFVQRGDRFEPVNNKPWWQR